MEIRSKAFTLPTDPGAATPVKDPEVAFQKVVQGLGHEVEQGESMMKNALRAARSGHDFSARELIALQVGVYRYSEALDLSAKLVDRATNGIKTVVQGQ
jgi:hypothetical protein